ANGMRSLRSMRGDFNSKPLRQHNLAFVPDTPIFRSCKPGEGLRSQGKPDRMTAGIRVLFRAYTSTKGGSHEDPHLASARHRRVAARHRAGRRSGSRKELSEPADTDDCAEYARQRGGYLEPAR